MTQPVDFSINYLPTVPTDVLKTIFAGFDKKTIGTMAKVCTSWNKLVPLAWEAACSRWDTPKTDPLMSWSQHYQNCLGANKVKWAKVHKHFQKRISNNRVVAEPQHRLPSAAANMIQLFLIRVAMEEEAANNRNVTGD